MTLIRRDFLLHLQRNINANMFPLLVSMNHAIQTAVLNTVEFAMALVLKSRLLRLSLPSWLFMALSHRLLVVLSPKVLLSLRLPLRDLHLWLRLRRMLRLPRGHRCNLLPHRPSTLLSIRLLL